MAEKREDIKRMVKDSQRKAKQAAKAETKKAGASSLKLGREEILERMQQSSTSKPEAPEFLAEHTVASGETLSGIAQKYYGSQANWKAIYEANKDTIGDNPSLIRVGQVFKIPKLD